MQPFHWPKIYIQLFHYFDTSQISISEIAISKNSPITPVLKITISISQKVIFQLFH